MEIPFYYFSFKNGEDWPVTGQEFWDFISRQSKGFAYDKNHNYWRDSLPRYFDSCMLQAPYPRLEEEGYDTSGQCRPLGSYGWEGDHPALEGTVDWTIADTNYQENFANLTDFIRAAASRNIHVLAIAFPESPYYKNTSHYTRCGPSWETGRQVLGQLQELENRFPLFHVYDAYRDGGHDYADSEAYNCNHLNPAGARKLARRLDSLIHTILQR
jgi:hypothetical protein